MRYSGKSISDNNPVNLALSLEFLVTVWTRKKKLSRGACPKRIG